MTTSLPDLNELMAKVSAASRAAADDPGQREALAEALLDLCEGLQELHEFGDAADASAEAMRVIGALVEGGRRELNVTLGVAMRHHADALIELGQGGRALDLYGDAVRLLADLAQLDPKVQPEFTGTLLNYGEGLRRCGLLDEALRALDQALELFEAFSFGADPDPTQVSSIALTQLNRGKALADLGRNDEAIAAMRQAVAVFHEYGDGLPQLHAVTYADALDALAGMLRQLGRVDEAIEPAEQGLEVITKLALGDAVRYLHPLARLTHNLGRCYQRAGHSERAVAVYEQAVNAYEILAKAQPHAHRITLAQVTSNYGLALAQTGQLERAYAIGQQALTLAEADGDTLLPLITGAQQFLADLAADLGRPERSIAHLAEGMRLLGEAVEAGKPGAREAAGRLGRSATEASAELGIALPDDVVGLIGELGMADE